MTHRTAISISPGLFRKAFLRVQEIHAKQCGSPLTSFARHDSLESYKHAIPARAGAELHASHWRISEIGSGRILERVIAAIELPGNNLLQWEPRHGPKSRVHSRMCDAQIKAADRRALEALLFNLYKRGTADQTTFEGLIDCCGKRYELLGYLFFIADPARFLPIRTGSFDKAFAELGVSLRTRGNCSWDNYQEFNDTLRAVRGRLHAEGIADASLLDAHSFCWILARYKSAHSEEATVPETHMRAFRGSLLAPREVGEFSPNDEAEVRDMQQAAVRRQASGQIAEEIAIEGERDRLAKAGRKDLAAKVALVSDKPGLGYDILSFETDGTERFIEVKNVTNGKRFFLSHGEWQNSRKRKNYWFYLVSGADSRLRIVDWITAADLKEQHLQAVQYLVRFKPR